jgi:hypothetical protein
MRVPRRKQCPLPPPSLSSLSALVLLDIEASIGKLKAPPAATLPAKPDEISRKRLRDAFAINATPRKKTNCTTNIK